MKRLCILTAVVVTGLYVFTETQNFMVTAQMLLYAKNTFKWAKKPTSNQEKEQNPTDNLNTQCF